MTDTDQTIEASLRPLIDPLGTNDSPEDIIPPIYNSTLSWKRWVKEAKSLIALEFILGMAILAIPLFGSVISVTIALFAWLASALLASGVGYLIYREYYRWRHEPFYCDPQDGILYRYQAKSKWFFLLGSDPQTLDLSTADYLPEPQTVPENYLTWLKGFKYSCTVTIDGQGQRDEKYFADINDFMYGDRISAIINYRRKMEQEHQKKDLKLQDRQAIAAEKTVEWLEHISGIMTTGFEQIIALLEAQTPGSVTPEPSEQDKISE